MESVDFLASCTCIYSTSRERKRLVGCCSILGPAFVWERSANVPAPSLTKAQHGWCGSLSSTNVHHLRATARFSSHCTEVCMVDSHVSHRFPPIHLTNRRTFALFTIPFNLQDIDETSQMRSGFPGNVDTSAQHSGQFLTFEGQTCLLGKSFTSSHS